MPGTILVSVLEFMDLPSSSPSSSVSIKVSMGRREYQTWDKGDFTFPLTTLRDDLVVLLQDSEGNEMAHTGIETKSIVEKGVWDELFPLKGGGNVHMKLQFVLSEEERTRIRMLRESALKKKRGELIISSPSGVPSTLSAGINVASSLCLHNEISDRNEETSSGITTLHQKVDLPRTESRESKLVEKTEAEPFAASVPARAICADEHSSILLSSSKPTADTANRPNLEEDRPHNLETKSPLKNTPSNVKKMISAFESGSAEDMVRPHLKPPPIKVRSNKTETGAPLKIHQLKEDAKVSIETADSTSNGEVNPSSLGDLQLGATDGSKPSHETGMKNKSRLLHSHQEVDVKKDNFLKDFTRTSKFETFQVSEKILGKRRNQPSNMLRGKRNSGGSPVIEESRIEVSSANSQADDILEASENVCASVANCEDHIPFESSGAWIFPDEAIRFCITNSGKKVMDLLGGCRKKPNVHQAKMDFSPTENAEEHNVDSGTGVEVDRNEKNQGPRKLKVENSSEDSGTSGGRVGQAIKVAIIIGFGTLVLLTRQRKNR